MGAAHAQETAYVRGLPMRGAAHAQETAYVRGLPMRRRRPM